MAASPKYLVFVDADVNHNKFYRMTPKGDSLLVEYGRVGCDNVRTATYNICEFDKLYRSKIKKGYQDKTDLVKDLISEDTSDTSSDGSLNIANRSAKVIVERLQKFANKCVTENYTISSNRVTKAMCDEAQSILDSLVNVTDVTTFNKELERLFTTIPRKMRRVKDYLISEKGEMAKVIDREQSILDTMRGQVISVVPKANKTSETTANNTDYLASLGLNICDVTKDEEKEILDFLGSTLRSKFKKAWKVTNIKTQTAYDKFLKDYKIQKEQMVWHGSRNENWWSILQTGLVLRPTNAIITGKMFGYGIYGALQAMKSYGYTSGNGSYWARGSSNTAIMAVFNLAYGIPYDVHSFDSKFYNFNWNKLREAKSSATCLHAHRGTMLRNDEIVVYKQEQMTIRYLVELAG